MRIIAGKFGGRVLESPKGHRTHPMSEKVRGGLFNALGELDGQTVLDAFAGSGALGLEALSRGAEYVTAIDIDKKAHVAIKKNIASLGLRDLVKPILASAGSWSDNNPDIQFNIVIAAPPYDDLQPKLLTKLNRHVKSGGLYILDWPGNQTLPEFRGFDLAANNTYGDAQLGFYRKV